MHPYTVSLRRWQRGALLLCCGDYICIWLSYFLALYFRFDFQYENIPAEYYQFFKQISLYYGIWSLLIYMVFRLYNCVWRFAGYNDLARCILAGGICCLTHWLCMPFFSVRMPLSYFAFGGILQVCSLVGTRFLFRFYSLIRSQYFHNSEIPCETAMLIGAGSAGHLVLRDLSTTALSNLRFKCIIDDDPNKWGSRLEGVLVVGGRDRIVEMSKKYEVSKIFIAIPRATKEERTDILNICRETTCEVKLLPGIYQFAGDEVRLSDMQNVTVGDLLRESSVTVDSEAIGDYFRDKVVLVTGGGGSIGSELCRQIAAFAPRRIIAFDHFENRVCSLQQELKSKYPEVEFVVKIGSVQDATRIVQVMKEASPQVVFHAAGYKHVALMEASHSEAIKNNVLGTYWTALAAQAAGAELFVYLSTDKAVNPASVLGASSRISEMLLQMIARSGRIAMLEEVLATKSPMADMLPPHPHATTHFASIRFGNAFGSEGSAFEMFQQQIALGGPVKVRHKEIKRFCMTVPDVVRLLLQACTFVQDDVTYVLDMGTPYSIDELVRSLIMLKGYVPDKDIKIEYTGLQPGEKLCDEPLMWEEGMSRTPHSKIVVANHIDFQQELFLKNLCRLVSEAANSSSDLSKSLSEVVHSYHASGTTLPDDTNGSQSVQVSQIDHLPRVANQFEIAGEVQSVVAMTNGYINRTYKVESRSADGVPNVFTLQRINTEIFKSPQELMDNYVRVTDHLSRTLRISPRDGGLSNPTLIPTRQGQYFYQDDFGCWRMLSYFHDVHSYSNVESPEVFYYAGKTFGAFLKAMSTLDAALLHIVIPDFHNTPKRYADLESVIAKDPMKRVRDCQQEIESVRRHKKLFGIISSALDSHKIPLRIGHNDCNLNNILFDDATNQPVAIIDLDTVMPSTPLYDFGDSIRSGANTAEDDERDLSKVSCSLELYESYARGWLEACGDMLTRRELELLPYASLVITAEDGIRFLTDHLQGDTYYHTSYHGQNLDRARTQIKLLTDMEDKFPQFQTVINDCCRALKLETK